MNRSIFFRVLLVLVLAGALVGMAGLVFRAGMAQGVAQGMALSAQNSGAAPGGETGRIPYGAPYPMWGWHYGPPFFGFGFFGFLIPLFLLFLFFGVLRSLFWGRHHHWGGPWQHGYMGAPGYPGGPGQPGAPGWPGGHGQMNVPPFFNEWHRQAHEQPEEPDQPVQE